MNQKFKVGNKVKIVKELYGHSFRIGSVQKIKSIHKDGYYEIEDRKGNIWGVNDEEVASYNTAHLRATRNNGFRFNLVAANGEIVATSEVYTTKAAAKKTLKTLFPEWEVIDQSKKKKNSNHGKEAANKSNRLMGRRPSRP